MTLTEFLLSRIAEDKEAARKAIGGQVTINTEWDSVAVQHHIIRWSSARVLAECEAKRQIVGLHEDAIPGDPAPDHHCFECGNIMPCPTLKALALPYADHDDYREEWRP